MKPAAGPALCFSGSRFQCQPGFLQAASTTSTNSTPGVSPARLVGKKWAVKDFSKPLGLKSFTSPLIQAICRASAPDPALRQERDHPDPSTLRVHPLQRPPWLSAFEMKPALLSTVGGTKNQNLSVLRISASSRPVQCSQQQSFPKVAEPLPCAHIRTSHSPPFEHPRYHPLLPLCLRPGRSIRREERRPAKALRLGHQL